MQGMQGMQGTREHRWGVIHHSREGVIYHTAPKDFAVTEYPAFYQDNPRLVASGLTFGEAVAVCVLMNAGGSDGAD